MEEREMDGGDGFYQVIHRFPPKGLNEADIYFGISFKSGRFSTFFQSELESKIHLISSGSSQVLKCL
ncbi:hypothetical protein B0E43_10175 [Algoriphagus sp. A40]|nr:hypothetical protein B0E43_10175 [Algoriphagus sp. A40]